MPHNLVLSGLIKLWDVTSGRCVKEFGSINVSTSGHGEQLEGDLQSGYVQLLYHCCLKSIVAVTYDHNVMVYGLPGGELEKQAS